MAGDQLLFHRGLSLSDLLVDDATVGCLSCDFREPVILIARNETDCVIRDPKTLGTISFLTTFPSVYQHSQFRSVVAVSFVVKRFNMMCFTWLLSAVNSISIKSRRVYVGEKPEVMQLRRLQLC